MLDWNHDLHEPLAAWCRVDLRCLPAIVMDALRMQLNTLRICNKVREQDVGKVLEKAQTLHEKSELPCLFSLGLLPMCISRQNHCSMLTHAMQGCAKQPLHHACTSNTQALDFVARWAETLARLWANSSSSSSSSSSWYFSSSASEPQW
eukprot:5642777-Amphidinium_carterae.1